MRNANFHIFYFQKRIVSAETIRGNTVFKSGRGAYLALLLLFVSLQFCRASTITEPNSSGLLTVNFLVFGTERVLLITMIIIMTIIKCCAKSKYVS